jgi:hypothetical protein
VLGFKISKDNPQKMNFTTVILHSSVAVIRRGEAVLRTVDSFINFPSGKQIRNIYDKQSLMLIPFSLKKFVNCRFPRLLTLSIVSIFIFTPFLISSAAWSATCYVDATNGNDANNGVSESTPWKTTAKVNASTLEVKK